MSGSLFCKSVECHCVVSSLVVMIDLVFCDVKAVWRDSVLHDPDTQIAVLISRFYWYIR